MKEAPHTAKETGEKEERKEDDVFCFFQTPDCCFFSCMWLARGYACACNEGKPHTERQQIEETPMRGEETRDKQEGARDEEEKREDKGRDWR